MTFAQKSLAILGLTSLSALLAGCYRQVAPTLAPANIVHESSGGYGFLLWLVRPSVDRLAARCPHGTYERELTVDALQGVGAFFTYFFWTPMTARVICARGDVAIGMTSAELEAALGPPTAVNRTTTAAGVREQWVYRIGDSVSYVSVENGRVTAVQDAQRPE